MKKSYIALLDRLTIINGEKGLGNLFLCNLVKHTKLEQDLKQRLSVIDETDPDLWEQRSWKEPEYEHLTAKKRTRYNRTFWNSDNFEVRKEFITRIISRISEDENI